MKKLVIAVALGLVFNTGLIAGTIGGERPDRSPSWVGSFVNKIYNRNNLEDSSDYEGCFWSCNRH